MKTRLTHLLKRNVGRASRIRGRVEGLSLWVRTAASPSLSAATGRSHRFERNVRTAASPFSSAATGRSYRFERDSRSGTTLVELLVVVLMIALISVALSKAVSSALTLEQNYREESAVRTALALQLGYAERYLSLANSISTNGGTNIISYPLQTGGVSFETNRYVGVKSNELALAAFGSSSNLNFKIYTGTNFNNKAFSADGLLRHATASVIDAQVLGTGAVRRLELAAEFQIKVKNKETGVSEWVTKTNTASRPIRLWNQ